MSHITVGDVVKHLHQQGGPSFGHNDKTEIDVTGHIGSSTIEVDGAANHTLFVLRGVDNSGHFPNAGMTIDDGKAFHGDIDMGAFSLLTIRGVWADSYQIDLKHDLLRLYQGDRVVDTFNVHLSADPTGFVEAAHYGSAANPAGSTFEMTTARFPNGIFPYAINPHVS
jgi:hypothetical protein